MLVSWREPAGHYDYVQRRGLRWSRGAALIEPQDQRLCQLLADAQVVREETEEVCKRAREV
jgi:hypothetical protein